jgi:hypothetical protein
MMMAADPVEGKGQEDEARTIPPPYRLRLGLA